MNTAKTNGRRKPRKPLIDRKPRILVLEGLSGAAGCITRAGGIPIVVSPRNVSAVDEAITADFDGLLLTGGGDVDPRLYGEKPHKRVYGVSETRDYTEWMALDEARELGVPVMGICRGHQLMTVHNGGALRQHIEGHRGSSHLVFGDSGARFRRIIGGERAMFVSLHHQVVKRTGKGWRVAARAKDGTIEAVESRDGRCLGVQFHPEMDYGTNEPSRKLFDWLVGEAAKRAGLVKPSRKPVRKPRSEPRTPRRVERPALAPRPSVITNNAEQMDLLIELAKRGSRRGVRYRYFCRGCGMEFDRQHDRDDHETFFHGTGLRSEPPVGHPDWE